MPTLEEIVNNIVHEYLENGGKEDAIKPVLDELKEKKLLDEKVASYFSRVLTRYRQTGGDDRIFGDCLKHTINKGKYDEELFDLISESLHNYRAKGLHGTNSEIRMKEDGLMPAILNDKLSVSGTKKLLKILIQHHHDGGNQLELAQIMHKVVNSLERYEHPPYFLLIGATGARHRIILSQAIHRKLIGELDDDARYSREVNRKAALFTGALDAISHYSKNPERETQKLFEEMSTTTGPIERPLIDRARAHWGLRFN